VRLTRIVVRMRKVYFSYIFYHYFGLNPILNKQIYW